MANIFASLNTDVTVIELSDNLIPTDDVEASNTLLKVFQKKGITILTKHR